MYYSRVLRKKIISSDTKKKKMILKDGKLVEDLDN
jgi:hypothetical protein